MKNKEDITELFEGGDSIRGSELSGQIDHVDEDSAIKVN